MLRLHLILHPLRSLVALLILGCIFSIVHAAPAVDGNAISWSDDGWYQVQRADDYRSLCEGGRACDVPDSKYLVINHSTGERFTDIQVDGTGAVDLPPLLADTIRAVLYPGTGGELFWARASDDKGIVGYEVTLLRSHI